MNKLQLLIIDPQNDFCDPAGALFVPGSPRDMERLTALVSRLGNRIDGIHVTLDDHHWFDIAHPAFWVDDAGRNPSPFTILRLGDVEAGTWRAAREDLAEWAVAYTAALEKNQRYQLCIWPPHCLTGTWGSLIHGPLQESLLGWEKDSLRPVNHVRKGSSILTEHYSALRADVPLPQDPATGLNQDLLAALATSATLLVAGEALSHCVRFTVQDLVEHLPDRTAGRLVILEDAMSAVPGFEEEGRVFLDWAAKHGVRVSTTADFLA